MYIKHSDNTVFDHITEQRKVRQKLIFCVWYFQLSSFVFDSLLQQQRKFNHGLHVVYRYEEDCKKDDFLKPKVCAYFLYLRLTKKTS